MKCVKNHTGDIKRVSNEQAERLVSNGVHTYCPKSEWKALRPAVVIKAEAVVSKETPEERANRIARKADKQKQANLKKGKGNLKKGGNK
jgi:hypothetical protein